MFLDFVFNRFVDFHGDYLLNWILDFFLDGNFQVTVHRNCIRFTDLDVNWIGLGIWNLNGKGLF